MPITITHFITTTYILNASAPGNGSRYALGKSYFCAGRLSEAYDVLQVRNGKAVHACGRGLRNVVCLSIVF